MAFVEVFECLVSQFRNMLRFPAAVVMIGGGGEDMTAEILPQLADGGAHGAFHFIEYHSLEDQFGGGIVRNGEFDAMSLLGEVQFIKPGKKHCVQIDVHEIRKVFPVLAGEGIGGPVTAGKGIHEGIQ